jgi:hypothetical protein
MVTPETNNTNNFHNVVTLPPNVYIRGGNGFNSTHYYHTVDLSRKVVGFNAVFDFGRRTTAVVIFSICLGIFFYRCCQKYQTDPARLLLPKIRKRTGSNAKTVEMMTFPTLRGLTLHDSTILQKMHTKELQKVLPLSLQMLDWSLAYASNRDGYNLETFYRLAEDQGPTLLVVTDSAGHVFGGFNSVSWERPKRKTGHTYGTGESFVFTVLPEFQHFQWSGANSEFIMSKHDCLAFGGGGKFALTLDERFQRGSSDKSDTYRNVCLASATMFDIVAVELWKFVRFR